jgi:serine/threonine protein kinase
MTNAALNADSDAELNQGHGDVPSGLRAGSVIDGKYRIEKVIGSGGMGVVLSAMHLALGQRVAIKLLRVLASDDRAVAVARFTREARAAARIQSEHVVRVSDVAALADGTPYMVMELLEGLDLRELLAEKKQLPVEEAAAYVLQACEALAEAHAAGIVHRDLKPSNLFVQRRGNGASVLKVLDFGISKIAPGGIADAAVTTTNSMMGSPLYMSPEQMKSSRDVDARADIWSLGAILYELIAGGPPFPGATIPEVCVAVMSSEPMPLGTYRADAPVALQAIIVRCLAKDPDARYATVAAFARALSAFVDERSQVHADRASAALRAAVPTLTEMQIPALPASGGRIVAPGDRAPRPPPGDLPAPASSKPSLKVWAALAITAAALLGLVAALLSSRRAPLAGPGDTTSATQAASTTPAALPPHTDPAPAATDGIVSVPFETLPRAAHDAGARGHAATPRPTPSARAGAAASTSASTSAPAPAPPAAPTPKPDDWKWGDRN